MKSPNPEPKHDLVLPTPAYLEPSAPKREGRDSEKLEIAVQALRDIGRYCHQWKEPATRRVMELCKDALREIEFPKAEGATAGRVMTKAEDALIDYMLDWADWPESKIAHRIKDTLELCRAVAAERAVLPLEEGREKRVSDRAIAWLARMAASPQLKEECREDAREILAAHHRQPSKF